MREENTTTENVAWWDLDSDQVIELINIALMCPDLQTLYLDGNNLGAGGLSGISTLVLSPETNLVELSLTDNAISSHGLKTVANGLRVNKTIRRVNLRNNECTAQGADYSGVQALADSLNNTGEPGISCNTTLLSLDISGNLLADQGALYVVEIFEKNMTLLELDLASNSIRDEGINAIVAALGVGIASGSKLSSCDLTDNYGMTRKVDGKISKLLAKNLSKRRALERHARGHSRAHRGCHLVPWHLMTEEVLPDPATLRRSPAKKKVAAGGDVEYDDED